MPSELIGLFKKLIWNQFIGKPTPAELAKLAALAASSGKTVGAAATLSDFKVNFGGKRPDVPVVTSSGSPPAFTLNDSIVITISFDPMRSWKRLDPLTIAGEKLLLSHEQGHYDITALLARDCFIHLMRLKTNTYPTEKDAQDDAQRVFQLHHDRLKPVQDKYDDDTTHGAWFTPRMGPEVKSSDQTKWEAFISEAFNVPRQPDVTAPDGAAYKVRLIDVLAQRGGFTF